MTGKDLGRYFPVIQLTISNIVAAKIVLALQEEMVGLFLTVYMIRILPHVSDYIVMVSVS